MKIIPVVAALATLGPGLAVPGFAADAPKNSPAVETTAPRPRSDTQPPLPIPPDHARASGETMKPPTEASMGAVDPKYKSGDPAKPR